MQRLMQLPCGSWIDRQYVLMVEAIPGSYCDIVKTQYANRVILHLQGNDRRVIDCESWDDAETLRDKIAGEVNAAIDSMASYAVPPKRPG